MDIVLYRGAQEIIAELQVDPETGEIGADYPLEVLVQRNPIGSAGYILHTQAQMKMIKTHIDDMQAKMKAAEKRIDRIKESLMTVMQMTGTTAIESPDATFKVKLHKDRDESIMIYDEKQLPTDYFREIPAKYEPDKTLIKRAIKDGFDVPGAVLTKNDRLEIK